MQKVVDEDLTTIVEDKEEYKEGYTTLQENICMIWITRNLTWMVWRCWLNSGEYLRDNTESNDSVGKGPEMEK